MIAEPRLQCWRGLVLRLWLLAAMGALGGCATDSVRGNVRVSAPWWMESAGSAGGFPELALKPFLECTSPARFLELQRDADMTPWVEGLDDWSAVRLGSMGPLRTGAHVLNRKRAAFLVTACEHYGLARAEVLALFIIHSAFDDDLRELLTLLASDKRLEQTLGRMPAVREALQRRALNLTDYADRPERLGDVARGLAGAASDALSSSELHRGLISLNYSAQRSELPLPYQKVLDEVERAQWDQAFSPGNLALGGFDSLTFGVPLGFYNLVAGTCHGVYSLSQGHYEQASRELAAAAVLVTLYAGGKGMKVLAESRGAPLAEGSRGGLLQVPELGVPDLERGAKHLWERLGGEGLRELARYIQASREAALFVYDGGEPAAVALHEARGDVARAQAWLSEAKTPPANAPRASPGGGSGLGGLTSLVDDSVGHSQEVVEARLAQTELEEAGPRLSADMTVLERQPPSVMAPPRGASGNPLWAEYVPYWEERLAELKQGKQVKPPLTWEGYEVMRGLFARGLLFERHMVALLREDALLPRMRRRWLKDFLQPRIETSVGVTKPGSPTVRYADALVIEEKPPPGQPPRVETFSFKSRDLKGLEEPDLRKQILEDARDASRYYGGVLDIRRLSLQLRGRAVSVQQVRLIYEGGPLKPTAVRLLNDAMEAAKNRFPGLEILVE